MLGKGKGERRDPLALLLARNLLRHDTGDLQICRSRGVERNRDKVKNTVDR